MIRTYLVSSGKAKYNIGISSDVFMFAGVDRFYAASTKQCDCQSSAASSA